MNTLARAIRGLIGLFIDDGTLALTLIVVLATVGVLARIGEIGEVLAMTVLVAGAIAALLVNVIRAAATQKS
jgi:hypothetical protein